MLTGIIAPTCHPRVASSSLRSSSSSHGGNQEPCDHGRSRHLKHRKVTADDSGQWNQDAVLRTSRPETAAQRRSLATAPGRTPARSFSRYSPAARRAASSICAEPKTRTIAAIVAVSFAGSVTVGCGGHLISIAAGVSAGWTSSISSRSDWVTAPAARNRPESLDARLSTGLGFATLRVFHRCR
jgi:hypothetical protein